MSSDNFTYVAPYRANTSVDHGGILLIVDAVGLIIAVFFLILRVTISKRDAVNGISIFKDDLLCFAAMVCCIIEFGLVWAGASKGNGKYIDLISPQTLVNIQQIQYAFDIFYIISLFCSRASVVLLFQRLQSARSNRIWEISLAILSSWAIVCVFLIAIKCNMRHPWIEYNVQCTDLLTRWQVIEISGIVIECGIFALSVYLTLIVRMKFSSKLKVVLLFATRSIVIIFAALRIASLPSYINSANPTYHGVPATVYALAETYSSVITATTPLLKSFIIKFMVIGAKPTVIITKQLYSTSTKSDGPDTNGDENQSKKAKKGRKPNVTSDPERGIVPKTEEDTFSEFEPWIPKSRYETEGGKAENISNSDNGSDRTLHGGDQANTISSTTIKKNIQDN